MDRLIVGCQQGTEGLARIPVSTLARRLNPSQTQLGRKFAEAEAMGSLGWSRANLCCGCRRISAGISCCPSGEACDHRCRFRGLSGELRRARPTVKSGFTPHQHCHQ